MLRSPPMMSKQLSDFPDLTQQRSRDSFPLRCHVAQVHFGRLMHFPCLGVRLNIDFTSSLLPPKVSPLNVLRIPVSVFTPPGLEVFR